MRAMRLQPPARRYKVNYRPSKLTGVSLCRQARTGDVNRPCFAIVCFATAVNVWACGPAAEPATSPSMSASSSAVYSDASLSGTYILTATLKPYVKFGGPQVGSGELRYDGQGNVSGHVVNFGVLADLKGTYHVNPDGIGTSAYTTTAESGTANGETRFRIVNAKEIEFESKDSPNRDWASAATVTQTKDNGVVGTLRKKVEP